MPEHPSFASFTRYNLKLADTGYTPSTWLAFPYHRGDRTEPSRPVSRPEKQIHLEGSVCQLIATQLYNSIWKNGIVVSVPGLTKDRVEIVKTVLRFNDVEIFEPKLEAASCNLESFALEREIRNQIVNRPSSTVVYLPSAILEKTTNPSDFVQSLFNSVAKESKITILLDTEDKMTGEQYIWNRTSKRFETNQVVQTSAHSN